MLEGTRPNCEREAPTRTIVSLLLLPEAALRHRLQNDFVSEILGTNPRSRHSPSEKTTRQENERKSRQR
jgi:hypothetical protein